MAALPGHKRASLPALPSDGEPSCEDSAGRAPTATLAVGLGDGGLGDEGLGGPLPTAQDLSQDLSQGPPQGPEERTVFVSEALRLEYYASQQQALNLQLRSALDDAAEALGGTCAAVAADVDASQRRWAAAAQQHSQALSALEADFQCVEPTGVTPEGVAEQCGMGPGAPAALAAFLAPAAARGGGGGGASPLSAASSSTGVAPSLTETLAPLLAELHSGGTRVSRRDDIRRQLEGHTADAFPVGNDAGVLAAALRCNEAELADPTAVLRAELRRSLPAVQERQARLAKAEAERAACLAAEDIPAAEQAAAGITDGHHEVLAALRRRTAAVDGAGADVDEFLAQYEDARGVGATVERLRGETAGREAAVDTDAARVAEWRAAWQQRCSDDAAAFEAATAGHRGAAEANAQELEDGWAAVQAQVARLAALATAQRELAAARAADAQREAGRRRAVAAEGAALDGLEWQLRAVRRALGRTQEFLGCVDGFCADCDAHTERKDWRGRYAALHVQEYVRAYDAYSAFFAFSSDRTARGGRRLENTKRLLRSVAFQVEHAGEAMDDSLPQYRRQQSELQRTVAALEGRLAALAEDVAGEDGFWARIEQVLEGRGVDYDPPQLRAQEQARELLQTHVEAADRLAMEEQRLLEREKRGVRSIQTVCEATALALQERRAVRAGAGADVQRTP